MISTGKDQYQARDALNHLANAAGILTAKIPAYAAQLSMANEENSVRYKRPFKD